jgi:hypothetical protein
MTFRYHDLERHERAVFDAAEKAWRTRALTALLLALIAGAFALDSFVYATEGMLILATIASFPLLFAIYSVADWIGKFGGKRAVIAHRKKY